MRVFRWSELSKFEDERGAIANIVPDNAVIKSALYITGKEGAVRGQHYHKKDVHYCCVIAGVITYMTKNQVTGEIQKVELRCGDVVANEGDELHKFVFETHGAFIALATEPRDQEHYEDDTVREAF